jgi:hypothetical protein
VAQYRIGRDQFGNQLDHGVPENLERLFRIQPELLELCSVVSRANSSKLS